MSQPFPVATPSDVAALLAGYFRLAPGEVSPTTRLVDDLYADSLQLLDIVMHLNRRYGVEIGADDLLSMHAVADVSRVLLALQSAR